MYKRPKYGGYWSTKRKREYLEWISKEFGVVTQSDWYKVRVRDIRATGGQVFLNHYKGTLSYALEDILPQFTWHPWLFDHLPRSFWKHEKNQRSYLEWAAEELGCGGENFHKWHSVKMADFYRLARAPEFLRHFNNSLPNALISVYHEYNWNMNLFERHKFFWNSTHTQRKYFDWIAPQLAVHTQEDWYGVAPKDFQQFRMETLVSRLYSESFAKAIMSVYPEFTWYPWLFVTAPRSLWDDFTNRQLYMEWLTEQLGIKTMEDWYNVTLADVLAFKGSSMLAYYNNSIMHALMHIYPEYQWLPWKFTVVPRNYWNSLLHQRKYLNWLADELGFETQKDWYTLQTMDLYNNCGGGFISMHYGKVSTALRSVFPEYSWSDWLFQCPPRRFFQRDENVDEYLQWLSNKLDISSKQDWYRISVKQIAAFKGKPLIDKMGGLHKFLYAMFPEAGYPSMLSNFHSVHKKCEILLSKQLKDILKVDVEMKYRHPQLFFPDTQEKIELDLFIPSLSIAFEYHGAHHYSFHNVYGTPTEFSQRDELKKRACQQHGITLIAIPYWWKFDKDSLRATIHLHRPDLIPAHAVTALPIPSSPPALPSKHNNRASSRAAL